MTGAQLRDKFLKFFEKKDHTSVPSSSLIPSGDPTLLFTNAGMVQFKNIFIGAEKRPFPRAVSAQKCLRVSGKHNDLENVGHTSRHHTFFEMLGNFSFGDYFKEDAIAFGWEFLTKTVHLPKKKLHVTVFEDDDQAEKIWKKVLGPKGNKIVRLGEKDNFWSMGDTGPCGPCSEILIDQGEEVGCGKSSCGPGCDCDRYLELWNLVFMQFERDSDGHMKPLPKPSIDTGLGLERLAAVVQGGKSNWESDLFKPIISRIQDLSGKACCGQDQDSVAIKVVADHSRAAAFLIADGILPSNEGRGYVLRRILRRALRYGKYIGLNEPFLFDTALVVAGHMSAAYPELQAHAALIEKVIRNEEERFLDTLARGLILFQEEVERIRAEGKDTFPGEVAFRLYDTYGFPRDLTEDMAGEVGLAVDQAGFDAEMALQREKARHAWDAMQEEEAGVFRELLGEGIRCDFTGYETLDDVATINAIIVGGQRVDLARSGDRLEIVTNVTPFYASAGGQVGDHGVIGINGSRIEVEDTVKPYANLIIHRGFVKAGDFRVGDRVRMQVDTGLRTAIMANHSATHLLQWALKTVLGDHVNQSGSLVESGRLRFDFTHFSPLTAEEAARVEDLVNRRIRENVDVTARVMRIEDAKAAGAIALFGEKYGDTVRMVSMGDFSKELCGGTHVHRTGDIGLFKIVGEGGIAAGVRRIEAVTGKGALKYLRTMDNELKEISERLKAAPGELVAKLDRLMEERRAKDREIEVLKAKLASKATGDILDGLKEVHGVKVLSKLIDDVSTPKDLRAYADRLRDRLKSGIALLGAKADGKAMLLALVTKDLVDRFHAGNIVKKAAVFVGGSGGGRPDMAQAGGPNVGKLQEALDSIEQFID